MPWTQVRNVGFSFDTDAGDTFNVLGNFAVEWHEDDMSGRLHMTTIALEDGSINSEEYLAGEFEDFVNTHHELIQDAAWSAVYSRLQSLLLP